MSLYFSDLLSLEIHEEYGDLGTDSPLTNSFLEGRCELCGTVTKVICCPSCGKKYDVGCLSEINVSDGKVWKCPSLECAKRQALMVLPFENIVTPLTLGDDPSTSLLCQHSEVPQRPFEDTWLKLFEAKNDKETSIVVPLPETGLQELANNLIGENMSPETPSSCSTSSPEVTTPPPPMSSPSLISTSTHSSQPTVNITPIVMLTTTPTSQTCYRSKAAHIVNVYAKKNSFGQFSWQTLSEPTEMEAINEARPVSKQHSKKRAMNSSMTRKVKKPNLNSTRPEPNIIEIFIETVKKRGLTYKEAADQLECSAPTLSRYIHQRPKAKGWAQLESRLYRWLEK